MVTVYGPRSIAEPMIAGVVRMHSRIKGVTPGEVAYSASDPVLLTWVHATAAYGFASAYSRYVDKLDCGLLDRYYSEGATASQLYGAVHAPRTDNERRALFDSMAARLEPSPIIMRFLQIMIETPALPPALLWLQPSLVRAAIDLLPDAMRQGIGLPDRFRSTYKDRLLAKISGATANRVMLHESPAIQSCLRLGLRPNYLYQ